MGFIEQFVPEGAKVHTHTWNPGATRQPTELELRVLDEWWGAFRAANSGGLDERESIQATPHDPYEVAELVSEWWAGERETIQAVLASALELGEK